eukprot:c23819_g1_i1 orf=167-1093(+)
MAMTAARPSPPLQDENSGKAPPGRVGRGGGLKVLGLKPQQTNERKILSDISNKLQPLRSKSSAGTPVSVHRGDKEEVNIGGGKIGGPRFTIRGDDDLAYARPGLQIPTGKILKVHHSKQGISDSSAKADRPPLKDINCNEISGRSHLRSPTILNKISIDIENEASTKFKFPSAKLELSEEMKKNAARWAQEGIEHVHFSGQDMEALAAKIEEEEMEKRIAQVLSYRTDLPLPRWAPVENNFWEFPDVLDLDPVQELEDDGYQWSALEGLKPMELEADFEDQLLGYIDTLPSLHEQWSEVHEDSMSEPD